MKMRDFEVTIKSKDFKFSPQAEAMLKEMPDVDKNKMIQKFLQDLHIGSNFILEYIMEKNESKVVRV